MARAPFTVVVLPFRRTTMGMLEYAIFRRADLHFWQPIAGGGEGDETPLAAARREAWEEAGISTSAVYYALSTQVSTDNYTIKVTTIRTFCSRMNRSVLQYP